MTDEPLGIVVYGLHVYIGFRDVFLPAREATGCSSSCCPRGSGSPQLSSRFCLDNGRGGERELTQVFANVLNLKLRSSPSPEPIKFHRPPVAAVASNDWSLDSRAASSEPAENLA